MISNVVPDPETGVIPANSSIKVTFSLTAIKTGMIRIPLNVKIIGQSTLPTLITLCATSVGPIVELGAKSLDFGRCEVLNSTHQKLTLINKSLISAEFTLFTKMSDSVFRVEEKAGTIDANGTKTIKIMCCPDEIQRFLDVL